MKDKDKRTNPSHKAAPAKTPAGTTGKSAGKKTATAPASVKFPDRLWAVILFVLAVALYANSIPNGYVLDDSGVLKDNFIVKKGFDGIPLILKTPYRYGSSAVMDDLYRPLSLVMFAAEWQISPKNPALSHGVNVFFFALSCALLFLVLRRFFDRQSPLLALFASLIWLAHPVHTEVVANIKSRDEIMAVFFLLIALLGFIRYIRGSGLFSLALAIVFYGLAMFSKEGVITCLAVFPLIGFFITGKLNPRILIAAAVMAVPAGLYVLIRHNVLANYPPPPLAPISIIDNLLVAAKDPGSRFATAVMILGKYLLLMIFPVRLVSDYSYNQIPVVGLANPGFILSLVVYGGALVYSILRIRTRTVPVFAILFYLLTISIYSNIFTLIGSSFGERFLFLPSLGFGLLLGWALLKLIPEKDAFPETGAGKSSWWRKAKIPAILLLVIFSLYSIKTIARNAEWESQWTLFSRDVERSPNSAHMRYYWGLTIRDKGKDLEDKTEYRNMMLKAIGEFRKAIEIYPYYPECYEQLGLAYFRLREYDESLKNYEEALKLNPFTSVTYGNMGIIYFQKGDLNKALELYKKAIELDPNYDDGYFNLGSTYGMMRQYDLALENFKKCIDIRPDYALAYYYLGMTYDNLNQPSEGQKYKDKAYELDPSLKKK